MLRIIYGNIFASGVDVLVNPVNCKGIMGAGLSLAFKHRFPGLFVSYKEACDSGELKPGTLHIWKPESGQTVINLPTKRDWQSKSRLEDIQSGLVALRRWLLKRPKRSVAIPALGCGHGGLPWSKIEEALTEQLADLPNSIFVYAHVNHVKHAAENWGAFREHKKGKK